LHTRGKYSVEFCNELIERIRSAELEIGYRRTRYDKGDVLEIDFSTVWPEVNGHGRFRIEKFVGGGFAGQVYPCILEKLSFADGVSDAERFGLVEGGRYALKIMIPPTRFTRRFRDLLYWLGFQAPFSAQINQGACRGGLLWQKLSRLAAGVVFGREDAVADVYASFFDAELGAYGEIREWVEGRVWRLEPDTRPRLRAKWRTIDPLETHSPEYVSKRQFMHRFVCMLHDMGAPELARQYEWWTLKSQPNVMKRSEYDGRPAEGLCAVDFRAGLALLPFLPMSPRDIGLIFEGIGRKSLVQFDRCDFGKLRAFATKHSDVFEQHAGMIDALEGYDRAYRRSMPDLTHQGLRMLCDGTLRSDVRRGLADGYKADGTIVETFADALARQPLKFAAFYALGAIPALGSTLRRMWGNPAWRRHEVRCLTEGRYLLRYWRAELTRRVLGWYRKGRCGEPEARRLSVTPASFWLQRLTVGFLPAGMHRWTAEPRYAWQRIKDGIGYMRSFIKDAAFREEWLKRTIEEGHREGMLDDDELRIVLEHVSDPYIVKYLKSVAVHLATLPVTQIVSVLTGAIVFVVLMLRGETTWARAGVTFGVILAAFQLTPISPGSICRGAYVVYMMVKDKDLKDYVVAAPLSFVKYIGYLAFPIQMAAAYPVFSRFMASRWATQMVHIIPVFGEKGALFEHVIFDMFYNYPRVLGETCKGRARFILDEWLILGVTLWLAAFSQGWLPMNTKSLTSATIAVVALFILPRILFYPMMVKSGTRESAVVDD